MNIFVSSTEKNVTLNGEQFDMCCWIVGKRDTKLWSAAVFVNVAIWHRYFVQLSNGHRAIRGSGLCALSGCRRWHGTPAQTWRRVCRLTKVLFIFVQVVACKCKVMSVFTNKSNTIGPTLGVQHYCHKW